MRKTVVALCMVCIMLAPTLIVASANPIPIPTILMPLEFINITVSDIPYPGGLWGKYADVWGGYPFKNLGYHEVKMYYPVPPDAKDISVKVDGIPIPWHYSSKTYPTILGDWPMIEWIIKPVPPKFVVSTYYKHEIPLTDIYTPGDYSYTLLYAMGTGKYLDTYAKQTTAYVDVKFFTPYQDLKVYTDHTPRNYTVTPHGIKLKIVSDLFQPLTEDLVILFKSPVPIGPVPARPLEGQVPE